MTKSTISIFQVDNCGNIQYYPTSNIMWSREKLGNGLFLHYYEIQIGPHRMLKAPDFCDFRKNLMLKDRKYFVTLGFFCEN